MGAAVRSKGTRSIRGVVVVEGSNMIVKAEPSKLYTPSAMVQGGLVVEHTAENRGSEAAMVRAFAPG